MKSPLRAYTATLQVLTPVSIGDGNSLTQHDLIVQESRGRFKVLFTEPRLFYRMLAERSLIRDYENFLCDKNQPLNDWLKAAGIKVGNHEEWISYALRVSAAGKPKLGQLHTCLRDPEGRAYIPGSTIKGMLRTALTALELKRRGIRLKARDFDKNAVTLAAMAKELETEIFCPALPGLSSEESAPASRCVLRGLTVGDSSGAGNDKLMIYSSVELKRHGINGRGDAKFLNVSHEAIVPLARLTFPLTIDTTVCPYTAADLLEALNCYAVLRCRRFLSAFDGIDSVEEHDPVCWLGRSTGFSAKTVINSLVDDTDAVPAAVSVLKASLGPLFIRHFHNRDPEYGLAPRICHATLSENRIVEMGRCRLSLEEC